MGDIFEGISGEESIVFFSRLIAYTQVQTIPIRDVRRPNNERNAPAENNESFESAASDRTETNPEGGPSDGCGDHDDCGYNDD